MRSTTHLPQTLVTLTLLLALPSLAFSSPQPALVSSSFDISLIPRNTLFLRQLSDLQTFSSALGGFKADSITNSGNADRPFSVGGDTFTDFQTAAQRTCDNQFNSCSQAANEEGNQGNLKVQDCDQQKQQCNSAQQSARVKDFQTGQASQNIGPDPNFPDFDLICDA